MPIKTDAGASGGTDNTDTSLNGEYRAGAGIYVNAEGQWTSPNGTVLKGQALAKAEANASAKYGVEYRNDNLYIQAVAEAKLRCEAAIKAEMQRGNHTVGAELYAYAEVYAWAGGEANVGTKGCWFEGGAIAGAKAGAGARTYYTNEGLVPFAVTNDTSVSVGAQVGAKVGGGYQVPDWNKDSKPITFGGEVNIALIAGVKTGGTVTVDVDPVYDMTVKPVNDYIVEPVKENVIQPIQENVVKPIQNNVVAPVKDVVDKIIPSVPKPSNPFAKKKKKKK
tara:strand:- start:48 stop:884 length:837 start_codon:yes stop_codon:yes gene_type:complete